MTFSTATDEAQKERKIFFKMQSPTKWYSTDQLLEISLVDPCKVFFFTYMQAVTYHLEALSCV